MKSLLFEGSYYLSPSLGAPYVAEHYGFPETFVIHYPFIWLLSQFTSNIYLIYNLVYLSTFVVVALVARTVLLWMGCHPAVSLLASWLYAFLPNHLERYDHYGIAFYAAAPLTVWFALRCCRGESPTRKELALLPFLGLCGPYPAAFACIMLMLGGLLGSLSLKRLRPLLAATGMTALVTATFLLILAPGLSGVQSGEAALPDRQPHHITRWSMRLSHLILPAHARPTHPLYPVSQAHYLDFPPPEEKTEAPYLGLVTVLAVLGLLLKFWKEHPDQEHLRQLFLLLFLLGTTGGLGELFTLIIGLRIRCYNRLSFHLAFVALAALAVYLSRLPWSRTRILLLCGLATLGMFEQVVSTPRIPEEELRLAQESVSSDRELIAQMEKSLPAGAMIWQLPHVGYPESARAYLEGTYGMGRGYAVSSSLHWSWGSLKGGPQGRIHDSFARMPIEEQLPILKEVGFAGVLVERRGYPDNGETVEGELKELGLEAGLQSPDGHLAFYPLMGSQPVSANSAELFEMRVWHAAWGDGQIDFSERGTGRLFARSGWGEPELEGRWSIGNKAWLYFPNLSGAPQRVRLKLAVTPFPDLHNYQGIEIYREDEFLGKWEFSARTPAEMVVEVTLPARLELRVKSPFAPSERGETDVRRLGVLLQKVTVESLEP